jgi:hypothetical protein
LASVLNSKAYAVYLNNSQQQAELRSMQMQERLFNQRVDPIALIRSYCDGANLTMSEKFLGPTAFHFQSSSADAGSLSSNIDILDCLLDVLLQTAGIHAAKIRSGASNASDTHQSYVSPPVLSTPLAISEFLQLYWTIAHRRLLWNMHSIQSSKYIDSKSSMASVSTHQLPPSNMPPSNMPPSNIPITADISIIRTAFAEITSFINDKAVNVKHIRIKNGGYTQKVYRDLCFMLNVYHQLTRYGEECVDQREANILARNAAIEERRAIIAAQQFEDSDEDASVDKIQDELVSKIQPRNRGMSTAGGIPPSTVPEDVKRGQIIGITLIKQVKDGNARQDTYSDEEDNDTDVANEISTRFMNPPTLEELLLRDGLAGPNRRLDGIPPHFYTVMDAITLALQSVNTVCSSKVTEEGTFVNESNTLISAPPGKHYNAWKEQLLAVCGQLFVSANGSYPSPSWALLLIEYLQSKVSHDLSELSPSLQRTHILPTFPSTPFNVYKNTLRMCATRRDAFGVSECVQLASIENAARLASAQTINASRTIAPQNWRTRNEPIPTVAVSTIRDDVIQARDDNGLWMLENYNADFVESVPSNSKGEFTFKDCTDEQTWRLAINALGEAGSLYTTWQQRYLIDLVKEV